MVVFSMVVYAARWRWEAFSCASYGAIMSDDFYWRGFVWVMRVRFCLWLASFCDGWCGGRGRAVL